MSDWPNDELCGDMSGNGPLLQPLDFRDKAGRTLWRLMESLEVEIAPNCYVKVPKMFVSNLGTIPRWCRAFVAINEFPLEFLIHDWLCNESQIEKTQDSGFSRWLADAILYDRLTKKKVAFLKRWLIWIAVRSAARYKGLA